MTRQEGRELSLNLCCRARATTGPTSVLRIAVGAATLTACRVYQSVDLAVAALDEGLYVSPGLRSQIANLLRGLCSDRGEQMLSGRASGQKLLLTLLLCLGRDSLGPSLGLGDDLLGLLLCLVDDRRRRGVEPRLVKDSGAFFAHRCALAFSLLACLRENRVGLLQAFRGGPFALPNSE